MAQAAQRGAIKMILAAMVIILVVNEYSAGDEWFRNVITGLTAVSGLIWAATVSPGRTFILCVMALCAVVAVELDRISRQRTSAGERLKVLDDRAQERAARSARRNMRMSRRTSGSKAA